MNKKDLSSKGILELLEATHTETLERAEELQDVLTHLRYEGKPSFGKNVKQAKELLAFFESEMVDHINLEETVLFPFLETHFPKLELAIHLLQAEHEDFKKNLRGFGGQFAKLQKEKDEIDRTRIVERIREAGTYLIYLLRHHMEAENKTLYRVLDEELHGKEREWLEKQIKLGEDPPRRLR